MSSDPENFEQIIYTSPRAPIPETITKERSTDCAPASAGQAPPYRLSGSAGLYGWLIVLFLCIVPAEDAQAVREWVLGPSSPDYLFPPTTASHANGLVTYAVNGEIYLLRPIGQPFGYVAQAYNSGNVHRRPVMASLPNTPGGENQWYVFASQADAWLVKLDVTASLAAPNQPLKVALSAALAPQLRDMRRPGCAADTLIAEPVVQRRADSNAGFTLNADIVMVATAHACGDTTGNQVVALNAADISAPPLWVFNSGEYEVGAFHACLPDLARNRIHCAAERPDGNFQYGIWSIDTNTGSLAWAGISDASVLGLPVLGESGTPLAGHLYVGDMLGRVHVLDANDGDSIDVATIAGGLSAKGFTHDLAIGTGLYAGMVYATSDNGVVYAVFDDGSTLTPIWESNFAGGQKVGSAPVPVVPLGKIYVGLNDGNFHQLDLSTGSDEAYGAVSPTPGISLGSLTPVSVYLGGDGVYRVLGIHYDPPDGFGMGLQQYRLPCQVASSACTFAGGAPVHPGPRVLIVDDDDNAPDVLNAYSNALDSLGLPYDVWDTRNSDVEPDFAFLGGYTRVIWKSGNASYVGNPFDPLWVAGPGAGEGGLRNWLDTGQCLLLSSQSYLDRTDLPGDFPFFHLGVGSSNLDAGTTEVTGTGSVFGGLGTHALTYPFANGSDEVIAGQGESAFSGDQGNAGVQFDSGVFRTVFLGFPFEALPGAPLRKEVLSRFLDYCALPHSPAELIFSDGFE